MGDLPASQLAALALAAEDGICHSAKTGWGVRSPAWWDGFDAPGLDALLAAKLIRIIPSKVGYRKVSITAEGRRALPSPPTERDE